MTRERARKIVEMFEFIKAYAEGKEIEVKQINGGWLKIDSPDFDSRIECYRVYTPNYRPFKNGYECMNVILKHGNKVIIKSANTKATINWIGENGIMINGNHKDYAYAFRNFKFLDSHVFGVETNNK